MSKSKSTKTPKSATTPKARKGKSKDFPRIAEALTQPLPTPEATPEVAPEADAAPAVEGTPEAMPDATPAPETDATSEARSDAAVRRHAKAGNTSVRDDKPARSKKAKAAKEPKPKKLGALNAAAQVLAANGGPMNCQAMIDAMAAQGLWTSPGGQTPAATLYSAMLREVAKKGDQSRFKKTERGHFAHTGV